MLEVTDLHVAYGPIAALRGVSLTVGTGQVVGVIGPNGAGKSTLMATICGVLKPQRGTVTFEGDSLVGATPERTVARGVSLVPEARHIFGSLTVRENLRLGATPLHDKRGAKADMDKMLEMFPPLQRFLDMSASALSGGQQQMLAIARALMSRPRMLLLDEPSLGLAPVVVDSVFHSLRRLRQDGVTLLLVEQNAARTLDIADYVYVVQTGTVRAEGTPSTLREDSRFESIYLGGA